jgi:hypothetical protein
MTATKGILLKSNAQLRNNFVTLTLPTFKREIFMKLKPVDVVQTITPENFKKNFYNNKKTKRY